MSEKIQRQGTCVYVLGERGCNKLTAFVQPHPRDGGTDDDALELARKFEAASEMLEAHEDGPDLDWYADRLVNIYGESEGADFVMALRRKAAKARAAIKKARGTP